MTVRVGIVANPLDPRTWEEYEVEDARALIMSLFPSWPASARIFDLEGVGDWKRAASIIDPAVLASRDVTPRDEASVERLGQLRGPLLVTIPPADPVTAIIAGVAIAVGIAAAFLLMPRLPSAQRAQSPNNALTDRTNQARLNGRIADIYGTVEATPDLLMVPYSIFEDNIEVELAYMAVGRGSYAVTRVRDGDTSVASIAGASAAIYGPGTSPNSGDAPQLQIGAAIAEDLQNVVKLNDVNGQVLRPTNLNFVQGEDNIRFVYPDSIESTGEEQFSEYFSPGDAITIAQAGISGEAGSITVDAVARFTQAGAIEFLSIDPSAAFAGAANLTVAQAGYAADIDGAIVYVDLSGTYEIASMDSDSITLDDPDAINPDWNTLGDMPGTMTNYFEARFSVPTDSPGLNLNGNYTILSLTDSQIVLNNPALVNTDWNEIEDLPGGATEYLSPSISRSSESWVGPFIVDLDGTERLIANIVSLNGLYTLSKKKGVQQALSVSVVLELTPINASDAAIGPAEQFPGTITGSAKEKTTVGISLEATPSFAGRCSVRMRRTTPTPKDDDFGAIVDEVKWRDCFGFAPIDEEEFGDLTTVHTRTIATPGALSVKARKLNMRVTRKLPQRISGSTFGGLVATDSAADIIAAICLDPFIGRRSIAEVDFDSIYDTISEVEDYFGSAKATEFGHTFDDTDISFEETLQTVAQAAFCTAYRQGRVIRLAFERATGASALIFNARNTIPGTQKRAVRFGPLDDHDGVELEYVAEEDGAAVTLMIPADESANSPRSLEVPGVRSDLLAYWQAWRAWNKLRYQNIAIELEATQEAALVIPRDRVLIADLTRAYFLQGEIEEASGTTLTLSQPAALSAERSWTIFLQHTDGTVEALGCEAGEDNLHVELAAEPRMALSVDPENFARSTYMIAAEDDVQTRAFLMTEREPNSNFTETVRAVNYSFLYYQHDELLLWLAFGFYGFSDAGPFERHGIPAGGAEIVEDEERGDVLEADGAGAQITLPAFTTPASYTKAAWIKRGDLATAGQLLGNANESFGFAASAMLQAGHGSIAVEAAWPDSSDWHHAAVAYDLPEDTMWLFIDGLLVASGSPGTRSVAQLAAFDDYLGRADDLRLWKRALSKSEIRAVFLASKRDT